MEERGKGGTSASFIVATQTENEQRARGPLPLKLPAPSVPAPLAPPRPSSRSKKTGLSSDVTRESGSGATDLKSGLHSTRSFTRKSATSFLRLVGISTSSEPSSIALRSWNSLR